MKKRMLVSMGFIALMMSVVIAQQEAPAIKFEENEHNFGKFKEELGPQTTSFEFTNTGSSPLVLTKVTSSCGCTTPGWTKQPVPPGGKGYVKATFNPRNMRGRFNKSVIVYTNGQPNMVVLRITGEVIPRVPTVTEMYPYHVGGVRLRTNHLSFAQVPNNNKRIRVVEVINTSNEPQRITFENVPEHVSLNVKPEVLKAGEKGVIEGTYDAGKKNDWGFVVDRFRILVNGEHVPNNYFLTSATITEDFTGMSKEELANAAKIEFESMEFNFGTMRQNASVTHEFSFTNEGKQDLVIRKVRSSCGCTAVKPAKSVLKPGESSTIKATFSSGARKGKQYKTITITTNDPKRPQITLKVIGEVLESN